MGANTLPDSRLRDRNKGVVVADWTAVTGEVMRVQFVPLYCMDCGAPGAYVPEWMTSAHYLCTNCAADHPEYATGALSDEQFWLLVQMEMEERFGHVLSQEELAQVVAEGKLGPKLEKLERESPYKVWNPC